MTTIRMMIAVVVIGLLAGCTSMGEPTVNFPPVTRTQGLVEQGASCPAQLRAAVGTLTKVIELKDDLAIKLAGVQAERDTVREELRKRSPETAAETAKLRSENGVLQAERDDARKTLAEAQTDRNAAHADVAILKEQLRVARGQLNAVLRTLPGKPAGELKIEGKRFLLYEPPAEKK